MIEFTYIEPQGGNTIRKQFETWKRLDKFVQSQQIKRYKVKGQSDSTSNMIEYTSVGWEEYMENAFKRIMGERKDW